MGTLFKIAWRNVWRHGKRTLLTVLTMMMGLGMFIWMDSILKGMDRSGLDTIVNLTDSSLRVSTKDYERERLGTPLDYGIEDVGQVVEFLRGQSHVQAVSARTRFLGQLSNGVDGIPVMAIAMDPAADAEVFTLTESLRGAWFPAGQERSLVIGKTLAADLGLELGDWITLSARTRWESNNADDFLVAGILETSSPDINKGAVFLSFADAEELVELDGLTTELAVRMERRTSLQVAMADSDELALALETRFPSLEAQSFGEIGRSFLELAKAKSKGAMMIIFVMLLIAAVGIANTILMSVYSRVREIGVLRAFGLKPKEITRLFLIEGGIIGIVGAAAGVLMGLVFVLWMVYGGFPMESLMGDIDMGLPIGGVLYGEWNPAQMAQAAIFGILVALLASWSPARKAGRLEVTDALRFV